MKTTIQLKDLSLGKVDAKNELMENSEEEIESFLHNFLIPENVDIDDFIGYKRFFILGFKGIGKTALLHFLDLSIRKSQPNTTSHFILFKSDIDENDISKMATASNSVIVDKNNNHKFEEDKYTKVWRWFLHRQIAWLGAKELESGTPIFVDNKDWRKYCTCVSALNKGNSLLDKLIPSVKRGNVKIELDPTAVKASLGLDLEWENHEKGEVKFNKLVDLADKLFRNLRPTGRDVYIFVDELEVSYSSKRQHARDVQLIKDLILTIYKFHREIRALDYPIRIISAIRSEIRNAINATGSEINKPLFDFGIILKWQQSGGPLDSHPLIKMINKRINTSERKLGLPESEPSEVWDKYFPAYINNQDAKEYILRRTWFRPRDIVRLLNLGRDQYPNNTMFSHQVFDGINKEYSSQSWAEMTEELSASYSIEEIDGIKRMLRGAPFAFTFNELDERNTRNRKYYKSLDDLLKKHNLGDILEKLYNLGIIGNTGENVRYSFRGDDSLILTSKMKIHDPLWNYFAVARME